MDITYRSAAEAAQALLREELELWRRGVARAGSGPRSVYGARVGRAAFGATLVAGALAITGFAVAEAAGHGRFAGWLTALLMASWPAAVAAYAFARAIAMVRFDSLEAFPATGDVQTDLAALRASAKPPLWERAAAGRASVGLPLIGLSLMAPLTLHLVVYAFIDLTAGRADFVRFADFDKWMQVSMVIVGHAHLALAFFAWRFACNLTKPEATAADADTLPSGLRITALVTGVAALPGVVLWALPPVITFVTGVVFIPLMLGITKNRVLAERRILAAAHAALAGP